MKEELLDRLIKALSAERGEYPPKLGEGEKFNYFRSLVNVRKALPISAGFLILQDEFLKEYQKERGITRLEELSPIAPDIYLWKGDITTLECDGIVNAANPKLIGCFMPCHHCIDNAIHTFAGIQLRLECAEIMRAQGGDEKPGTAKITKGYNLPAKYVLHTVGPTVGGRVTKRNMADLKSCYISCLELAEKKGLKSIAFPCISTGEYRFPKRQAAQIAVEAVREYKRTTESGIKVVFDVFADGDFEIYEKLLLN